MTEAQTGTHTAISKTEDLREFYARYVEMANTRDFDGMREILHEEVDLGGQLVPRDAIITEFRKHTDAVPDIHWEVDELLVDGDRLSVRATDTGTPVSTWHGLEPNGSAITVTETAFYQVVDGKFARMWYLMDINSLKTQLA